MTERILRLYKIYGFKRSFQFSFLAVRRLIIFRFLRGSFSQDGTDLLIDKLLGKKKTGFYVDIGANHPTKFSNTYRFYKKGWRGINIDPNPGFLGKFKEKRKQDINLNMAISDRRGKLTFFNFNPDVNSTFDKILVEKCLKEGCQLVSKKEIKVCTLSSVLARYAQNKEIDFISIDTEGWDLNVLKGNDWQKNRPKVICVETTKRDEVSIRDFLTGLFYKEAYSTTNSRIYIDRKSEMLDSYPKEKKTLTIVAAHMQTPEIMSGGDKIFFELAKIWSSQMNLRIITPSTCYQNLKKSIKAEYSVLKQIPFIETGRDKGTRSFFFVSLQFFFRIFLVYRLLNKNDRIIYSPGDFISNVVPGAFFKMKNKETIFVADVHHLNESPFRRRGNLFLANFISFAFQRASLFLLKRYADAIFLLNQEMKHKLLKIGFSGEKLFIVGSGLDFPAIEKYPKNPDFNYDAVFFGRICPTKGMLDLPKIWKIVIGVIPKAKLGLIGYYSSPWKEIFEKEVGKYKLKNNIQVLGFLPDRKAYGILKSAKIFISPSYEEGWGMSMCEAKVCRLPVIAYDLPVYNEIFEGGVILVPKGDTKLFAEKILSLLDNEKEREKLAEEGIKIMKNYDWQNLAKKKLEIINDYC